MAVYVGIILGVLASMAGTAGKQLFRLSELTRRQGTPSAACCAKALLVVGLVLNTAVGPLIDMASYAFANQSLIAPLGALDVVWNTITAPCTLGETLTPMLVLGCALIFGGAVTTSLVGSHHEDSYTIEEIQDIFLQYNLLVYMIVLFAWLAFNILVLMPRSAAPKGQPWRSGDRIRGLSLGMTAGSIAGNMFCVKAFVEIVQGAIVHQTGEYFKHWLPWVVLAGAIIFAVSNLYFLTKAMSEYEAVFMGAVFEGSLIFAASVSGCVVFKELDTMTPYQIFFYWAALGVIILGIFVVCEGAKRKQLAEDKEAAMKEMEENPQHCSERSMEEGATHEGQPKDGHTAVMPGTPQSFGAQSRQMSFGAESHTSNAFGHIPSLLTIPELPAAVMDDKSSDGGSARSHSTKRRSHPGSEGHHRRTPDGLAALIGNRADSRRGKPATIQEGDEDTPTQRMSVALSLREQESASNGAYLVNKAQTQQGLFPNIVLEHNVLRNVAACVGATGSGRLAATSRLCVDGLATTLHKERGLPGRWTYADEGADFTYCIRPVHNSKSEQYRFEEKLRDGSVVKAVLTQSGDWAIGRLKKGTATHGFIRVRTTGEHGAVSNFKVAEGDWGRDTVAHRVNYEAMMDDDIQSHLSLPSRDSSVNFHRARSGGEFASPGANSMRGSEKPSGANPLPAAPVARGCAGCMPWLLGGPSDPRSIGRRDGSPYRVREERQAGGADVAATNGNAPSAEGLFLADNSALQATTEGLALRRSKSLEDSDWCQDMCIRWGEAVTGSAEGDGWLRVGEHFLPMAVDGVNVLVPVSPSQPLQQKQESSLRPRYVSTSSAGSSGSRARRWNEHDAFALCKEWGDMLYRGSATFLDKQAASSVAAAVEGLNRGSLSCAEDFCVAFVAEEREWWVLYRQGARALALKTLGLRDPDELAGGWRPQDSFFLCREGEEGLFHASRVLFLEPSQATSVRAAAEALNKGELSYDGVCCVVFSSARREWHVLHRPDRRASAYACLGVRENGNHSEGYRRSNEKTNGAVVNGDAKQDSFRANSFT